MPLTRQPGGRSAFLPRPGLYPRSRVTWCPDGCTFFMDWVNDRYALRGWPLPLDGVPGWSNVGGTLGPNGLTVADSEGDVVKLTDTTGLGFTPHAGTVVLELDPGLLPVGRIYLFDASPGSDGFGLRTPSTDEDNLEVIIYDAEGVETMTISNALLSNTRNRVAASWGSAGLRASCNGSAVSFDLDFAPPMRTPVPEFAFARRVDGTTEALNNAVLRNFTLYDRQLTDPELVALSAL